LKGGLIGLGVLKRGGEFGELRGRREKKGGEGAFGYSRRGLIGVLKGGLYKKKKKIMRIRAANLGQKKGELKPMKQK